MTETTTPAPVRYAEPPPGYCACGELLHYTNPQVAQSVMRLIQIGGSPMITVRTPAGSYLVPRHYIALHGIVASELPSLGFRRVDRLKWTQRNRARVRYDLLLVMGEAGIALTMFGLLLAQESIPVMAMLCIGGLTLTWLATISLLAPPPTAEE